MPNATPNMPNRAPVPRFCKLYSTAAGAAFVDGVEVLLAVDVFVDVVGVGVGMLLVVLPVAEAVSLKLSVTLWVAQSCRAKSSVSGTSVR